MQVRKHLVRYNSALRTQAQPFPLLISLQRFCPFQPQMPKAPLRYQNE